MIQSYDLYLPTHLIFGKGRVTELARLIKGYGSKVLLTYGGGSVKRIGLYDTVREILHQEGCTVFELSGIAPNPKIESVREGVRIVKENGIDFIVAIGGGSVLRLLQSNRLRRGVRWRPLGSRDSPRPDREEAPGV